jgi:parallel beta-helix repeat protein
MVGTAAPVSMSAAPGIFVGTCGKPSQPTIQAAVNASSPGGTVLICPGTYPEQVTITKNLTVSGVASGNADQVVIAPPSTGVVINTFDLYLPPMDPVAAQVLVQNANVSLSSVTVDGANNGISSCATDLRGIYYQNASGSIQNVTTRNQTLAAGLTGCQSGEAIFAQSGYGSIVKENLTIQNNNVHTFQKNGITADGETLNVNINGNYITGQGATTGAAENGIQISTGTQGKVQNNTVIDMIWAPDTSSDPGNAAAGIILVGSESVEVSNNIVGSTQFAIGTFTDSVFGYPANPNGLADHNNIRNNQIQNTLIFDAIDVCSNNNQIQNNTIFGSTESGIHLDSTCGSTGTNNNVSGNTINEACAGILEGATPNNIGGKNDYFNVVSEIVSGDVCPIVVTGGAPSSAVNALSIGRDSVRFGGRSSQSLHPAPAH